MKLFTSQQTKELDALTIEREPISSFNLMQRASQRLADAMKPYLNGKIAVAAGNGNNGGDALIVAHILLSQGYDVDVFLFNGHRKSADCQTALDLLSAKFSFQIKEINHLGETKYDSLIDGLFGTGLNRPLEGAYADAVDLINQSGATVLAIDTPSGLFGEDNSLNDRSHIVKATATFTIGTPKIAFFFRENHTYVGDWKVIDINHDKSAIASIETPYHFTTGQEAESWLIKRDKFSHKGTFGHALLIAGSQGMMGAAQLATKAALRAGCGLLTAHIPLCGYQIMQIAVPEAIVSIDEDESCFSKVPSNLEKYNAIGIGPGLGRNARSAEALRSLLQQTQTPMLLDADALNILSENKDLFNLIPPQSILTPHPKEFERLAGKCDSCYEQIQRQREISNKHHLIILLKGAHTSIGLPDGSIHFNSTGNPCLATAGSGDVLSGIILSLLAQGYEPSIAARLGAYLHGKAADRYAKETHRPCMLASDITEWIYR